MRWIGFLSCLLLISNIGSCVRVLDVQVPLYMVVGEQSTFRCHFDMEGETLYSLKWWKNEHQFFQFIPRNDPQMYVFNVPGVHVDVSKSSLHEVRLMNVTTATDGQFRCEIVAEAPTFNTHSLSANTTVIDAPDGPPIVSGLRELYFEGETIVINCTSYHANPPPTLNWEILEPPKNEDNHYLHGNIHHSLVPTINPVRKYNKGKFGKNKLTKKYKAKSDKKNVYNKKSYGRKIDGDSGKSLVQNSDSGIILDNIYDDKVSSKENELTEKDSDLLLKSLQKTSSKNYTAKSFQLSSITSSILPFPISSTINKIKDFFTTINPLGSSTPIEPSVTNKPAVIDHHEPVLSRLTYSSEIIAKEEDESDIQAENNMNSTDNPMTSTEKKIPRRSDFKLTTVSIIPTKVIETKDTTPLDIQTPSTNDNAEISDKIRTTTKATTPLSTISSTKIANVNINSNKRASVNTNSVTKSTIKSKELLKSTLSLIMNKLNVASNVSLNTLMMDKDFQNMWNREVEYLKKDEKYVNETDENESQDRLNNTKSLEIENRNSFNNSKSPEIETADIIGIENMDNVEYDLNNTFPNNLEHTIPLTTLFPIEYSKKPSGTTKTNEQTSSEIYTTTTERLLEYSQGHSVTEKAPDRISSTIKATKTETKFSYYNTTQLFYQKPTFKKESKPDLKQSLKPIPTTKVPERIIFRSESPLVSIKLTENSETTELDQLSGNLSLNFSSSLNDITDEIKHPLFQQERTNREKRSSFNDEQYYLNYENAKLDDAYRNFKMPHFIQVDESSVVRYPVERDINNDTILYTSTLGLILKVKKNLSPHGILSLRCKADVHIYEWSTEVQTQISDLQMSEPQQLPALQKVDLMPQSAALVMPNEAEQRSGRTIYILGLYMLIVLF